MTNPRGNSVTQPHAFTTARKMNVIGLVMVICAIVIQLIAGVDYPVVPPGLIILPVMAGLVAFGTRWRWTAIVGLVVPLFMTVGGLLASPGLLSFLAAPADVVIFGSAIIQVLGLLLAIIAGIITTFQNYPILGRGMHKGGN